MRRGVGVGVVLAAAAVSAALASSAFAVGIPRSQFCIPQTLVDYAPPAGLPTVRGLPASAQLPFAPTSRVRLGRDERSRLQGGMGLAGNGLLFDLGALGSGGVPVDWKVETRLVRISPKGKPGKLEAHRLQRIRRVPAGPGRLLGLRPNSFDPGLYLLELTFANGDGRRLARYSEYVRVATPLSEIRLAVNGIGFRPEETVWVQVQNPGTDVLIFEDDYLVERLDGGTWVRILEQPPVAVGTYSVEPGEADSCEFAYGIPRGAPPGQYRITKSVLTRQPGTTLTASAEFTVEAPG